MSREAYNEYRKSEEFRAKRRATRDLVKERISCRAYYQRNLEKMRKRARDWGQSPEGQTYLKEYRKKVYANGGVERGRKKVQEVKLSYARELLVKDNKILQGLDIPIELIKAKQAEIKLKRLVDDILPPEKRKAIAKAEKMALTIQRRAERAQATKERRKTQARARYHYNIEKAREKNRIYQEKNREAINAKAREKYHANREKIRAERKDISPEKRAHINALSRAREARVREAKRKLNQEGVAQ